MSKSNIFDINNFPPNNLRVNDFSVQLSEVGKEIGKFDELLKNSRNRSLLLSPIITNEAVISSRIEGIDTEIVDVFKYQTTQKTKNIDQNVLNVVNCRLAMIHALDNTNQKYLDIDLIKVLHKILLTNVDDDKKPGCIRERDVNVINHLLGSKYVVYEPPPYKNVTSLLNKLDKFTSQQNMDSLIQVALMHAQFELIHPFLDGNGRVGRIMIALQLYYNNFISYPSLYISNYFDKNRRDYYRYLKGISQFNNWTEWVDFFLTGLYEEAKYNYRLLNNLIKIYDLCSVKFTETLKSKVALNILNAFYEYPILNASLLVRKRYVTSRAQAYVLLNKLSDAKLIQKLDRKDTDNSTTMFTLGAILNELVDIENITI